jgi:hypothetical protein
MGQHRVGSCNRQDTRSVNCLYTIGGNAGGQPRSYHVQIDLAHAESEDVATGGGNNSQLKPGGRRGRQKVREGTSERCSTACAMERELTEMKFNVCVALTMVAIGDPSVSRRKATPKAGAGRW